MAQTSETKSATSDSKAPAAKKAASSTVSTDTVNAGPSEAEQREQRAQGVAVSPTSDVPVLFDAERERTAEYVRLVLRLGPDLERVKALRDQGVDVDSHLDDGEVKDQVRDFEGNL